MDPFRASEESPEWASVQALWTSVKGNSPIYDFLIFSQEVEFVAVSKGLVKARLTLTSNHVNSRKSIHGAVSATLVDFFGGAVIATYGFEKTGVSTDIHVTYTGTANVGDVVEIEATISRPPRTLGFTQIRISKIVDGEPGPLVANATHTKYIRQ